MLPPVFRLVSWILQNAPRTRYNLSSSGLPQPELEEMGLETSYRAYRRAGEEQEGPLAESVADLYGVEAHNVVFTTGASEAIFLAYSVFGKGKAVVPLPNYEPMFAIPRWLGMEVTSSLEHPTVPGAVYGTTSPNNPTGSRLDSEAIDQLARASGRATVFVNETYGGFTFAKPVSFFPLHERFVTCTSLTKFYGLAWLRVGWMLANRSNAELLRKGRQLVTGHNSEYSLWLARQVLARRNKFVDRARRIHSENLALVRKFAKSARGVRLALPEAAPFCLVHYSEGPDSVTFARRLLREKGVLVSPGDYFGAPRAFRLCFTSGRAELSEGLDRLSAFLDSSSLRRS